VIYAAWLFGFSVLFLFCERLMPRRKLKVLRKGIWNDLFYLIVNGEYLGVLIGAIAIYVIAVFDRALDLAHLKEYVYMGVMADRPLWLQFLILLIVFDFCQWGIHNLLHRVPWLWEFHKVHHSITDLDWIGHWRFHWFEAMFYKMMLYIPAAFFGFSAVAMFWYAVVSTCVGHFAHSNLRLRIGPLRYIINSPEMHVWHHNHPSAGPFNKNFGLTLSLWDWLFGTAHVPKHRDPQRLGFDGDETFPRSLWRQLLIPITTRTRWGNPRPNTTSPQTQVN
jgi:sterol desaturase/sphingolipid hydroxylase (fatty acid hydroxylase superfamily)